MPRFHHGHDQHRRADQLIRRARERVLDQAPLDGDFTPEAGYNATCAWHRFIYLEQAADSALEYVQTLSLWDFCQFLGDLVVARAKSGKAQDRYFCELATRVTTAARIRPEAAPVERLAQQRTEILHLADQPHLSDHFTTIAPYSAWITTASMPEPRSTPGRLPSPATASWATAWSTWTRPASRCTARTPST
ncbi:hypothetical protein ACFWFF_34755 [Streptomyces sp. NPDC060223]|uniref:hypothetical protein n=1 Tax=unclassified Streptomyces TaxID=2593676 RepID=UPI00363E9D64